MSLIRFQSTQFEVVYCFLFFFSVFFLFFIKNFFSRQRVLRVRHQQNMLVIFQKNDLVFCFNVNYLSVQYFLPPTESHLTFVLLTISDVNEFSASSTVGLCRSDADVFKGDEFPEKANQIWVSVILKSKKKTHTAQQKPTHISTGTGLRKTWCSFCVSGC